MMMDSSIRIWRTPYSNFYEDETLHANQVYSTEYLEELADEGFSAVWMRGILRNIVQTDVFPNLGENADRHQKNLQTFLARAEELGIGVWLYMQPPLGFEPEDPFWDEHPEVRGITRERDELGSETAMCVSEPRVQKFLREGTERLSCVLPSLEGVILITASEHMQHCFTGFNREMAEAGESMGCERCNQREPKDIISDIVGNVKLGFDHADNGGEIVAWNWSWNAYEDDPQRDIIQELPEDLILMAGFERGDTKEILGKQRTIDEYALSFAGPSDRFLKSIETAREHGMDTMAKLQIATTHELATVPNLPIIGSIYQKAAEIRRHDVDHFMGCWNFGNMFCSNTTAFLRFLDAESLSPRRKALTEFAESYFPGCRPEMVADAWETFGEAMDFYPFGIPFIYRGPLNYAVAHPIEAKPLDNRPVGPSWIPESDRGDELEASFGEYTLDEIINGLDELYQTWMAGAETFERAVSESDAPTAREEINSIRMAGHSFHSGWNLYRAYQLRQNWSPSKRDAVLNIMHDERDHLCDILPIVEADDRMGFHSECQHYMFDAEAIRQKIINIDDQIDTEV